MPSEGISTNTWVKWEIRSLKYLRRALQAKAKAEAHNTKLLYADHLHCNTVIGKTFDGLKEKFEFIFRSGYKANTDALYPPKYFYGKDN